MLGWSINLFRVFGIRLAVHFSFLLLLAYAAWQGWADAKEQPWLGAVVSAATVVILFTCVVLHELGHSLTARRFGIGVPRILLLPIGGMAEFDRIPREPRQELLIALAGPAVNFAWVLVLVPFVPVAGFWTDAELEVSFTGLGQLLFWVNLIMGCFNLLPIFPMDGGRILRALLAMRWPYLRATFWAATLGKVLAVIGVLVMAFALHHPLGTILFGFIFIAGEFEYRAVKRREEAAAQWERMIKQLYATTGDGTRDSGLPPLLHGRN
jgi:Zn-dependent protease